MKNECVILGVIGDWFVVTIVPIPPKSCKESTLSPHNSTLTLFKIREKRLPTSFSPVISTNVGISL